MIKPKKPTDTPTKNSHVTRTTIVLQQ